MNRPSPKLIGAFVTAALVLAVAMVMFFGSSTLWTQSSRFILFFDQSVNGLNVGSPVKFRGVPVGTVERIMIRVEGQEPDSTAIPVIVRVDRTRLMDDLGVTSEAFDPNFIADSIDRGLVARLSLESFITGQLFVEFSFNPERSHGIPRHLAEAGEMREIPTLSSSLDDITDDAADIISRLSELDFERLGENVNQVLENTATVLAGIDSEGISRSIVKTADAVSDFIESGELSLTLQSTRETLQSAEETLAEITKTARSFNLEDGPLTAKLDLWSASLTKTMEELQLLSTTTSQMMAPDGSLRYELETMLREMSRASRSIRALADYLEENPNSIITGRPGSN